MPPEPHGAAAAECQRGESGDGRARRAWVDGDGSRSATLGELLTVKNGEGLRIWWPPPAASGAQRTPSVRKTPKLGGPGRGASPRKGTAPFSFEWSGIGWYHMIPLMVWR
jgi:hypothetical protein